jgi:hypothetical protein
MESEAAGLKYPESSAIVRTKASPCFRSASSAVRRFGVSSARVWPDLMRSLWVHSPIFCPPAVGVQVFPAEGRVADVGHGDLRVELAARREVHPAEADAAEAQLLRALAVADGIHAE